MESIIRMIEREFSSLSFNIILLSSILKNVLRHSYPKELSYLSNYLVTIQSFCNIRDYISGKKFDPDSLFKKN